MKKSVIMLMVLLGLIISAVNAYAGEADAEQGVYAAELSGFEFTIPEVYQKIKGFLAYNDLGNYYSSDAGVTQSACAYYPMGKEEYGKLMEQEAVAEAEGDIDTALSILSQMHGQTLFRIYGINGGRGVDDLIESFLSVVDPENIDQLGYEVSEEEIADYIEEVNSNLYMEIGTSNGFTYILETMDPEKLKDEDPFPGYEDEYYKEYLSLVPDIDLIKENIRLTGDVMLRVPIEYAPEGAEIHFETMDLDGDPVKSEDLFAGHPVTMINLWATWCPPCINELSALDEINQELAEKNCRIIGIVTDAVDEEVIGEAKDILEEKGATYTNLTAFDGLGDMLPQDSWPTSCFVDENGFLLGDPIDGARVNYYLKRFEDLLQADE